MSFRIDLLHREHGVPMDQVAQLERWYGPAFTEDVRGPSDGLRWAVQRLPWPSIHPILRRWFATSVSRGMDLGDFRIKAVFDLLVDEPDPVEAERVTTLIFEVIQVYAMIHGREFIRQVNGVNQIDFSVTDPDPTIRMWLTALPICAAALNATRGLKGDAVMVSHAIAAIRSVVHQPSEGEESRVIMDRAIREAVAALSSYMSTWIMPWKAA